MRLLRTWTKQGSDGYMLFIAQVLVPVFRKMCNLTLMTVQRSKVRLIYIIVSHLVK